MLKFLKSLYGVYKDPPSPNWHIERKAKKSKSHPLSGFWKRSKCHDFGLAIGPVSDKEYYISVGDPGCIRGPGSISMDLSDPGSIGDPGCIRGPGSNRVNTVHRPIGPYLVILHFF